MSYSVFPQTTNKCYCATMCYLRLIPELMCLSFVSPPMFIFQDAKLIGLDKSAIVFTASVGTDIEVLYRFSHNKNYVVTYPV